MSYLKNTGAHKLVGTRNPASNEVAGDSCYAII